MRALPTSGAHKAGLLLPLLETETPIVVGAQDQLFTRHAADWAQRAQAGVWEVVVAENHCQHLLLPSRQPRGVRAIKVQKGKEARHVRGGIGGLKGARGAARGAEATSSQLRRDKRRSLWRDLRASPHLGST